jgi:Ca-activated chloride channel homolog
MTRTALLFALVFSTAIAISAQGQGTQAPVPQPPQPVQAPAQQPPPRPLTNVTRLVIVPVTVKDSRGQLVGSLSRNDFRILSDNVEQKIVGFSSDPVPISAVVLIDNDLGDKQAKQVQTSLKTISAAFGPGDEVAVVTYDQYPTTVSNFTQDNDTLYTDLKRLELGSHNTFVYPDPATSGPISAAPNDPTSAVRVHGPPKYQSTSFLDDALYSAGQMLKDRGRDRRKIIFLVSDGSDARDEKHPYAETLTSLLEEDVSVFSISVTHSIPIGKSLVQHGESALGNYALKTGGDTFFAAKPDDLERMYTNLTEEARNEYTLTFSPATTDTAKDYHPIEVRVENHGSNLNILTRDGYYLSAVSIGR